jgi:hypothetical protein
MEPIIQRYRQHSLIVILSILIGQSLNAQINANLNILDDQLVQPILRAIDSINTGDYAVQIASEAESDISHWGKERLRSELIKREIPVLDENLDTVESVYKLNVQNISAQIFYRPVKKNLLLRNSRYERNITTLLSYYILENNESIIYSYSKTDHVTDTLKTSQLREIENSFYEFTKGERVESGWIRKFFEPALITITTIGIIYLFYSLRSG